MAPLENRKPTSNIATSSGWLAPGSFKAPCQPPSVVLMPSLPAEAQAVVVPNSETLPPLPTQHEDFTSQDTEYH